MKKKVAILLLFISLILTGCWDKIEINERGFILGLGIDKLPDKEKKEKYDAIKVELKYPNVAMLGMKQSMSKDPSFYKEGNGESFNTIIGEIETLAPFKLELSFVKVIVLGKDIIKDDKLFRDVLDGIEREKHFSRKIYLLSAKDEAQSIIKCKPKEQPIIGLYFRDVLRHAVKEGRVVDSNLNIISKNLQEGRDTILAKVENKGNSDVDINGASIIKNFKYVGDLNDRESRIYNLIVKDNNNIVDIHVKKDDVPISYEINRTSRKMKISEKSDALVMDLRIETEGDIAQHRIGMKGTITSNKKIKEIEALVQAELKGDIQKLMEKLQKEYEADVVGVQENIYKHDQKLYKKTQKHWNNYYKNMIVNVEVSSKIRRIGIIR